MTGKAHLRDFDEVLRDEMVQHDRISAALKDGPKTVPEIAEALGAPPSEVLQWVMAMRRYGQVRDLPKGRADDYYQYELVGAPR
jgi:predicted Rossmann fold nucleotide-binding protein DprA/Smf involved in DNA uptake